jgi:hypothetical protein
LSADLHVAFPASISLNYGLLSFISARRMDCSFPVLLIPLQQQVFVRIASGFDAWSDQSCSSLEAWKIQVPPPASSRQALQRIDPGLAGSPISRVRAPSSRSRVHGLCRCDGSAGRARTQCTHRPSSRAPRRRPIFVGSG